MVTSLRRSPNTTRSSPPPSSGRQATQVFICDSILGRSVSSSRFRLLSNTPSWIRNQSFGEWIVCKFTSIHEQTHVQLKQPILKIKEFVNATAKFQPELSRRYRAFNGEKAHSITWLGTLYTVSFCRRVSFCMYCRLNFFGIMTSFSGRSTSEYCFSRAAITALSTSATACEQASWF